LSKRFDKIEDLYYTTPMKQSTQLRRQVFISCGLSDKEATLYDLLLTKGQASASELEKESKLKKNTYTLLKSLVRKHLALPIRGKGREVYQAAPPMQLHALVISQEESTKQTRKLLESALPDMLSDYRFITGKPVIQQFHGEEGLKEIFDDVYADDKKEILGCVGLEHPHEAMYSHIMGKLMPVRVKRNIVTRALNTNSPRSQEILKRDKEELRETFLTDQTRYPLPAEIDVFNNKIAFLSFVKDDFSGVIIENKEFAESLTSVFRLLFDLLRSKKPVASA
jgi:sugar-specific transcriptional regulator TrmB